MAGSSQRVELHGVSSTPRWHFPVARHHPHSASAVQASHSVWAAQLSVPHVFIGVVRKGANIRGDDRNKKEEMDQQPNF